MPRLYGAKFIIFTVPLVFHRQYRSHRQLKSDRLLGWLEATGGYPEKGLEYLYQALRISPRDPLQYSIHNVLAHAYFLARDYAKSIEYGLLGASEAPSFPSFYGHIAVSYVGLGDLEKAKAALERVRLLSPEWIQSRLNGFTIYRLPEYQQRVTIFLRIAAGLEDPNAADAFR